MKLHQNRIRHLRVCRNAERQHVAHGQWSFLARAWLRAIHLTSDVVADGGSGGGMQQAQPHGSTLSSRAVKRMVGVVLWFGGFSRSRWIHPWIQPSMDVRYFTAVHITAYVETSARTRLKISYLVVAFAAPCIDRRSRMQPHRDQLCGAAAPPDTDLRPPNAPHPNALRTTLRKPRDTSAFNCAAIRSAMTEGFDVSRLLLAPRAE